MVTAAADRLLALLVPKATAAAEGAGTQLIVCDWSGCSGNPCLARLWCCDYDYSPVRCYWATSGCVWTC